MSHATETDMLHAAKDGPIVTLNVTSHRCDALVIQADKISSLELPNLDIQSIQARSSDPQSVETLSWLWDTIVLPVLDYLGYHGPPAGTGNSGSMPHIWWIPTGSLIGFPLHAAAIISAGIPRQPLTWLCPRTACPSTFSSAPDNSVVTT